MFTIFSCCRGIKTPFFPSAQRSQLGSTEAGPTSARDHENLGEVRGVNAHRASESMHNMHKQNHVEARNDDSLDQSGISGRNKEILRRWKSSGVRHGLENRRR